MKRYFTVLALLGILGFAGVSIAEKASESKEVKEVAASICNSDSTSQGSGLRVEVRDGKKVLVDAEGHVIGTIKELE